MKEKCTNLLSYWRKPIRLSFLLFLVTHKTALLRLAELKELSGHGEHHGGSPMRSIEEAPQS
jgi:hypothetical protein